MRQAQQPDTALQPPPLDGLCYDPSSLSVDYTSLLPGEWVERRRVSLERRKKNSWNAEMESLLMTVCDGGMGGGGVGGMGAAYISGIYQLDSYPPPPLPCPWDACQEGLQVDISQTLASSEVYPGCESDSSICMHSVGT